MKLVKMIWEFHGPDANSTAKHHVIHLKEFVQMEKLQDIIIDNETINENYHTAFMVIPESLVSDLRSRLRPHRGQWYVPNP